VLDLNNLLKNINLPFKNENYSFILCEKIIQDVCILSSEINLIELKSINNTLILLEKYPTAKQLDYLKEHPPLILFLSSQIENLDDFTKIPYIQFYKENLDPLINEIIKIEKKYAKKISELIYNDYPQLVQLVVKGSSIEKILNTAAEILGNPLIMTDKSYDLLAYSKKQNINDPIWQKIVENNCCPYNIIQMMDKEGFLDKLANQKSPVFLEEGKFSNFIRRLVCEVNVSDEVKGFIALLEYNKKITLLDKEIMKFISLLTATELSKNDAITKAKGKLKDDFMRDLIEGKFKKTELALNRAKALNWKLKDYYQIICIKKINNKRFTGQHLHSIQSLINKIFPKAKISSSPHEILFLLLKDKNILRSQRLKKLKDYCIRYDIHIGIGRQKNKITNIVNSYKEANKALYINKKTNKENILNFYTDLSIYDIANEINQEKLPKKLQKLINHDQNNNSNLIKTLKIYYQEEQNMNKTSKKLFVHRNTVRYRLDKISDLLNWDINEYSNRLKLELGLLKLEMNN